MPTEKTDLHERINSGKPILLAEVAPPATGDPAAMRSVAQRYAGKVHALGVCDNRDRVGMSALAAASLVASQGVEPIVHVVTRDRNRIALVSDYLGSRALGIGNLLCTSGTHQTLGRPREAKNVFDIDSVQLLQTLANLADDGSIVGEPGMDGCGPVCLGAVASPFADPLPMQLLRLAKKTAVGAHFFITQPVFDQARFEAWWNEITGRDLHQRPILAGIRILTSAEAAKAYAGRRPDPRVPDEVVNRIALATDPQGQREAGIQVALSAIERLRALDGLRGFSICGNGDDDAAIEVIEKSGLGTD